MHQVVATPSSRSHLSRAIVLIVAMLASLVVISPPAGAATTCTDDGLELLVRVDEPDGGETELEMRSGVLYVNDVACGSRASILVVDDELKADRLVLNTAAGPFRANGRAVFVQVILDDHAADGSRDEIVVRGSNNKETIKLESQIVVVLQDDLFPGPEPDGQRLLMGIGFSADPKMIFLLRGGPDVFFMNPDVEGHFLGFVSVRGGSGNDEIVGGPGRQRLRGGSGNDVIRGSNGNDKLWGNSGDDDVRGGKGDDIVKGGSGDDLIKGNSGADTLTGGKGFDRALGGSGRDSLLMADGEKDRVRGGKGADTCDCDSNDNVKSAKRV